MTLRGLRVLVLEDEPIIALAIEDALFELGATPVLAERVADAEAALAEGGFDAAILDVNLHGQRSYPVAHALAALGLPFIFATGYGDAEHPDALRDVPTITKPYGRADIAAAFAGLISPIGGLHNIG